MGPSSSRLLRVVPAAEVSDGALCRAYLKGDGAALGQLLARHQATVLSLVRRYARTPDDARELTQRAMVQAFEAARRTLPRFERTEQPLPFKAWLLRIAINLGKNHRRDQSRWRRVPLEDDTAGPAPQPNAQAALEEAQLRALVSAAVERLPKRQREVFRLRIDGGLPFAEVAEVLGIAESNAKVHFHHAVKRLRAELGSTLSSEEPS